MSEVSVNIWIPDEMYKMEYKPVTTNLKEYYNPYTIELPELREIMSRATDNYSYLVPEVIAERIYESAFPKLVARQLLELVTFKGTTYTLQKGVEDSIQATVISEGTAPPISEERFTEETVTPEKLGTRIEITQEAIEDARIDLLPRQIRLAGEALAKLENQRILNVITANGTSYSGSAPITLDQILDMITTIDAQGWEADTIVMHPYQYRELMKTDDWKDANDHYQANSSYVEQMLRGQKGRLWGMLDVLVTTTISAGTVIVIDRKVAGIIAQNRAITAKRYEDTIRDTSGYLVTERLKAKIIWSNAIVVGSGFSTS